MQTQIQKKIQSAADGSMVIISKIRDGNYAVAYFTKNGDCLDSSNPLAQDAPPTVTIFLGNGKPEIDDCDAGSRVFVHSPTEDVVFVKTDDAWMLESSMAKQPISTEKSAAKKTDRVVNQMLITVLQPLKKVAPQAIDLGQMYDAFVKDDEAGKALMDVLQYLRYGKFIELSDEQVRLTHTGRSYLRDLKRAELAANRSSASA